MAGRAANIEAILQWCQAHRPDIVDHVQAVTNLPGEKGAVFALLMTTAFEAGRMFQTTVENPTTYEPFDTEYYIPG